MTKTRTRRKPAGFVVPEPEPIFVPVHAASMSTPIFASMVAEFGEPDLNPHTDELPCFAEELAALHTPDLSMRQLVPAWALDTGEYLAGRVALDKWMVRMGQEKADKEIVNGRQDSAFSVAAENDGPGSSASAH